MPIPAQCDRCHKEMMEKGAIILSPPKDEGGTDIVQKYHLCVKCYEWLVEMTIEKPKKRYRK